MKRFTKSWIVVTEVAVTDYKSVPIIHTVPETPASLIDDHEVHLVHCYGYTILRVPDARIMLAGSQDWIATIIDTDMFNEHS